MFKGFKVANFINEVIYSIFKIFNSSLRFQVSPSGFKVTVVSPQVTESVDERLKKIDSARQSLTEAISAINELEKDAQTNKQELQKINTNIERAENKKVKLETKLDDFKKLAAIDAKSVREAMGVPSNRELWVQRTVGFIFGVIASLVAAIIWHYVSMKIGLSPPK